VPVTLAHVARAPRGHQAGAGKQACPANLATRLASTGKTGQLVTAEAATTRTSIATVELWQRAGSCWKSAGGPWGGSIGVNGFSDHHREGDGTTPTGFYAIGPVVYGNGPNPGTKLAYHRLVCGDWWDEDPTSPQYNTFQHVPCGRSPGFGGDSEALWTETAAYPSFAVVEYNTHPVVPYAGSAIFIHADTGTPTVGCVAVPLADLDYLLRWLRSAQSPAIVMGPAGEITRF
jgi:L,D-peptidoglycan transpeptidase YkuD (ErfK/YbiS/YcfS/YnhG family)